MHPRGIQGKIPHEPVGLRSSFQPSSGACSLAKWAAAVAGSWQGGVFNANFALQSRQWRAGPGGFLGRLNGLGRSDRGPPQCRLDIRCGFAFMYRNEDISLTPHIAPAQHQDDPNGIEGAYRPCTPMTLRTGIRLTGKTIGFRAWARCYREAKVRSPKSRGVALGMALAMKSGSCGARGLSACNLSLAASVEESLLDNLAFEATC
jgi:hypothetical protein